MNKAAELSKLSPPDVWDRFAWRFLKMNEDMQFGVAQDEADLEAVFRLRYTTVIEEGWGHPANFPDGLERDIYDEYAIQLVGRNGDGDIVATGRVVLPVSGKQLPTEVFFDLEIEPREQVVDVGRGIVAQNNNQRHLAFLGLMSQAWVELRKHGYYEICASMTKSMLRLYRLMDMHWIILGEPRRYWNEERFPCKFDLTKTVEMYLKDHVDLLNEDSL